MEQIKGLSLNEWMRLYDEEGPFEYVDGEFIPLSPNIPGHIVTTKTLFLAIQQHSFPTLGEPFTDAPFVLVESSDWVKGSRVPDILYFQAERLAAYKAQNPDWRVKPFILVPDLVGEVISPNDRYTVVLKKVEGYLRDGVQLVWVIDPQQRLVLIDHPGTKEQIKLTEADTLTGDNIIPGFSIVISTLFA